MLFCIVFLFFCATIEAATPLVKTVSVPGGYAYDTLAYGQGGTWTTNLPSGEVAVLMAGSWQGQGFNARYPVMTTQGIACYDNGYPALWNGTTLTRMTEEAQFSSPFMPISSSEGGDIAYAKMSFYFLVVSRPSGVVDGYMPFNTLGWSGSWWLTGVAFTPGGTMYVAGQNTATATNGGYRVVGQYAGTFFDTGMTYSEIAYGGGLFVGVKYDHSAVEAWSLYSNGSVSQKYVIASSGYYNLLGGGPAAVAFSDASRIYQVAIPEPGSLIALLSGLIGLGGLIMRRK